jgi:peptide/nickel transport system substrate-binding protein
MRSRKRSHLFLATTVAAALALSACATRPSGDPAPGPDKATGDKNEPKIGGKMVYAATGDPVNFNPILQSDTTSGWVVSRVFSSLVKIDEKLNVEADLATEWSSTPDGLQWTFKLRSDVKFHDGKPLTAEDVAYTYNAIKDKGYSGPRTAEFASVAKVEVVDPATVKFILNEPYSPLLTSLTYGILPKHLYADKPVADMKDNPANRKPIGSGPWRFGEWATGQYVALTRNDDYYGKGPFLPDVRMKFVQDTNVAVAQLEAGEVDNLALPAKEVKRVTASQAANYNFYKYQDLSFEYLGFNMTKEGLKDPAVRHAFAYAIDREKIVSDILEGEAVVMDAPIPPASWAYEPNVTKYRFDAKKATDELEKAGYKKGADGIYAKDGKRLSYTLLTNSGNTTRESMALMIQKSLKDVGVEIKTEFIEWSVFLEKYLWVGNFDMMISGFSLGVDPDQYDLFHSSQAKKNDKGRFVGFNRSQFNNPQIDKLLEDGRKEGDKEKRKAIYSQYQKLYAEEIPWLILFNRKSTVAIKKNIAGVVESPQGPIKSWLWYATDAS